MERGYILSPCLRLMPFFLSGLGTILTSLLCLSAQGSVDSAASIFQQLEFVEYILGSVRLL